METPLTKNIRPGAEPMDLAAYQRAGGYQGVRKALAMSPKEVRELVTRANLRGRGGAGFNTGMKWSFVPSGDKARHPTYLVINADEMEPGTFKDRLLLEGDPHSMVEGAICAAYAIGADMIYLFIRGEYVLAARRMNKALAEARAAGLLGKNILGSSFSVEMVVHTSAGRYMCGEETGLLNALEGKRANPRTKPPYPQVSGLFGQPTVVNNVETLCNVHHIVNNGAEWFKSLSRSVEGGGGTKLYGVSGKVKKPGLWELPMGVTVREILDLAGGMRDGLKLRGFLPGGASTDFMTEQHLDVKMDFDSVARVGSRMGTGTMIVMDDQACPVDFVHNLMYFFARESCGWCTPCREGLPWTVELLRALEEGRGSQADIERLERLTVTIGPGRTFCALGPGAVEPLQSALKYFRDDFVRHVTAGGCPWKKS